MGIRISEMEEATTFGADDYVPIVTSGTNKKALGQKIKDFIAGFFVSKSGDTMTGDLTVEKSNGEFRLKNPNVTINTTANNGVTASQTEGVMVKDSANNEIARFITTQETNGDVIAQMAVFNKKTDGTSTNNYINVAIKKDGTRTYSIADGSAFRENLGLTSCYSAIKTFSITSSSSYTITFRNMYKSMILLGFAQGIGNVILSISSTGTSIDSVKNLVNLSTFSNSALTFTASTSSITISSSYSSESKFTALLGNI